MTAQPQQLTIRRPDDWHIHLRDDEMLKTVLPYTSAVNGRAIVMPNPFRRWSASRRAKPIATAFWPRCLTVMTLPR